MFHHGRKTYINPMSVLILLENKYSHQLLCTIRKQSFLAMADGGGSVASAPAPARAASTIGVLSSDESDEEVEEVEVVKAKSQAEYYDDNLDDQDEAWAIKQRQGRKSDAVLSCPACFTTLSIDSQRHEQYVHQYRAMFVTNCRIVETERLRLPAHRQGRKAQKKRKKGSANTETTNGPAPAETEKEEDIFKPVHCSVCDTEVAVIDKDEVYHFFNIVPSYS